MEIYCSRPAQNMFAWLHGLCPSGLRAIRFKTRIGLFPERFRSCRMLTHERCTSQPVVSFQKLLSYEKQNLEHAKNPGWGAHSNLFQ